VSKANGACNWLLAAVPSHPLLRRYPSGPLRLFFGDDVITIVITLLLGLAIMTKQTTIRAIGNSAGTTIPKPMLERYHMGEGDTVHLVETEEGILITPFDPDFEKAMAIYAEGAKQYRNAMRELAK
jgi:putative addiction module antidote